MAALHFASTSAAASGLRPTGTPAFGFGGAIRGAATGSEQMHFATTVARSMRSAGVRRIMVVDDFAVFRAGVRQAMTVEGGPEWIEAATLAQAVGLGEVERPDLVLLDLNLPDSRGLATLLAARRAFVDVPIVVVIGKGASADDRQGMVMAGAAGTLARGADERALAVALRAAVADTDTRDGRTAQRSTPGASARTALSLP